MSKIIHITHNDADGVGCAVIFKLYNKYVLNNKYNDVITLHTSNHGIQDEVVSVFEDYSDISELIISDISPAKDTPSYNILMDIYNGKKDVKVTLIDHHLTNPFKDMESTDNFSINVYTSKYSLIASNRFMDNCKSQLQHYKTNYDTLVDKLIEKKLNDEATEDLIRYIIDRYFGDDISATFIMYVYYLSLYGKLTTIHPNLPKVITDFVYSISRYDTWEWCKHPIAYIEDIITNAIKYNTVEIVSDTLYYTFSDLVNNTAGKINETLEPASYIQFLPDEYTAIEHVANSSMEKYMSHIDTKLKVSSSGEYLYGIIANDNSVNMSVVSERIEKLYPNIFDYIVILYSESKTISFRTARDTVDVSRIAQRCYGGGGHRKAAGAMVDISTFVSFLTEYWISDSIGYIIYDLDCSDDLSKLTSKLVYDKIKHDLSEEGISNE